ncbi:bleomycin resistance protein [Burkholderia sp. D-99]|uniref:bleomycin resistance protein n=1 Tax=Burkholderia sp. D-99 TaxID=2717316 RepID=UPI001FB640F4|nr:bleomycin resistance protein [Burkholderia sp. D-99]
MASPNLLSRDFEVTARFYDKPGFAETWHEDGWPILKRGDLLPDYFSHSELDTATSGFHYGFRLANVGTFFNDMLAADNSEQTTGRPRARIGRCAKPASARWAH